MRNKQTRVYVGKFIYFLDFFYHQRIKIPAEPEWSSGIQHCACCTDGRRLQSANACGHVCKYMDQKGSAAILTSMQSVGVTLEKNLRITQVKKHAKNPPWLWNPGHASPEVQNRGINFKKLIQPNPRVGSKTQGFGYHSHCLRSNPTQ